jgi:acyl-CoA reductase-like NAD-dependent aldehyde dehydrogenase
MLKHLNHPDHARHLIGGRDVPAADGARLDVLAPGDGQPSASIAADSAADIDAGRRSRVAARLSPNDAVAGGDGSSPA